MSLINKYIENQFNPFLLSKIHFDAVVYEKLIPPEFGKHFADHVFFRIMYAYIVEVVKIVTRRSLRSWLYTFKDYDRLYSNKIVFYLTTQNNLRALQDVIEKVRSQRENVVVINKNNRYQYFPSVLMLIISLLYIPTYLHVLRELSERDRRIAKYFVASFLFAPGYTWFYYKLLGRCRPECFVMANDHGHDKRSLMYICAEHGINTIYTQHASVSYAFPPLSTSFSFLDGLDAFEKYTANEKTPSGIVILLGACRYDRLSRYRLTRRKEKRNCIGIAVNRMDDNKKVDDLCNHLLNHFPNLKIKVRTHPAMKNHPFSFTNKDRIIYTCASDEPMVEYLDSIDVQISNDSGVHLDTILGGVPTICYNMSRNRFGDNYGYVNSGLLYLAKDFDELITFIARDGNQLIEIENVRKYDASYGTFYSGKCSEMIADFIVHGYDFCYFTKKYGFSLKSIGVNKYYITNNE